MNTTEQEQTQCQIMWQINAIGNKIAQMLIRPLYPSKMEIVEEIGDTGRGGYGSTGN